MIYVSVVNHSLFLIDSHIVIINLQRGMNILWGKLRYLLFLLNTHLLWDVLGGWRDKVNVFIFVVFCKIVVAARRAVVQLLKVRTVAVELQIARGRWGNSTWYAL